MTTYENSKPEQHAGDAGMKRKMLLDWHLVLASLAIVALLNWSTSAHASPGSMLESEGKVIAPVTTRISDTVRAGIMLPSARKSRTVTLAEGTSTTTR